MRHKIMHRASRAVNAVVPKQLVGDRAIKRMVTDFAERAGMVYFGYVSQLTDEHRIVRGLTVSIKHRDDHYCIGTYNNYDVVFVERTDTILTKHTHVWHIMEFDLKTKYDVPHMFIGSSTHGFGFHSLLKAKYAAMAPLVLDSSDGYSNDFTDHYSIYAVAGHSVSVERYMDAPTAEAIAKHFKGLVIEVTNDALYVYSEKSHLTPQLLDTMIANGAWLAQLIDQKSQLV